MPTFCPECDQEIEDDIVAEWDYREEFDFECPSCKYEMAIVVEAVPYFYSYKKSDLNYINAK